ncbi:MAG: nitrilase-related carbon-nitrogen hydrolase [Bacteroidota bacterium]
MLHDDEKRFFINGNHQTIIDKKEVRIAPAICYESLQATHFEKVQQLGATIYLASVAKPQNGIDKAYPYFAELARHNSISILMVNCIGYCDNFFSVGQSAVWNKKGQCVGQLSDKEEGILLYDTKTEKTKIVLRKSKH